MGSSHLKRLFAPKTWQIKRKNITFVVRPSPGAHTMDLSIPLKLFLIDAGLAKTMRDVTYMLKYHDVQVDGKKRRDAAFAVGLFDVVSFPEIKKAFTLIIDQQGKLSVKEIDGKTKTRFVQVKGKKAIRGKKIQISTACGKNILVDEKEAAKYKVGDTLVIELSSQKITNHLPLKKSAKAYLIKGLHAGTICSVEDVQDSILHCKEGDKIFETKKKYAYIINDELEKIIQA